ncbi:MAG TPA: pitrilysin family protein [Halanaerobiales bacterium]|nr:pitrilysin family protein [Halanaerobiales bacterium]
MEENYNEIVKETVYKDQLANGLTVLMMPRKNYNRKYGILAANFGSIDTHFVNPFSGKETTVPDGIAHFLEHKLFEGEKGDVFSIFAQTGASANAFTNYTTTAYLFSSTDKFKENMLNLLNFVQEPFFTEENVDKEKGIISQEIKMYQDNPDYQVYKNTLKGLFHNHPVKNDIAGTIDTIRQISVDDLSLCYQLFYNPGNMVFFLTGGFEPEEIIYTIKENQSSKNFNPWKNIKRIFPAEPATIRQSSISKEMDVNNNLLYLGIKENILPASPQKMLVQELSTKILLELIIGKGSALYQNLYEKGLIDNNFSYEYVIHKNYGYLLMGGETKDSKLLSKYLLNGINQGYKQIRYNDFTRYIRKHTGKFIKSLNSFNKVAYNYIDLFFKDLDYFDLFEELKDLDFSFLKKRYHDLFKEENYVQSIIKEKIWL